MNGKVAKVLNKFARKTRQKPKTLKTIWRQLNHKDRGKFRKMMNKFV